MKVFILLMVCAQNPTTQEQTVHTDVEVFKTAELCLKAAEQFEKEYQQDCTAIKASCKVKEMRN